MKDFNPYFINWCVSVLNFNPSGPAQVFGKDYKHALTLEQMQSLFTAGSDYADEIIERQRRENSTLHALLHAKQTINVNITIPPTKHWWDIFRKVK